MAIFRCNKCAHLEERPDGQLGETVACPKCGNMAPVYGTQFFVAKLLDKYFAGQREISRLKTLVAGVAEEVPMAATASSTLNEIDFFNTDSLASDAQHGPICDWFKRKQITVQANMRGVDTTGFFDEVAVNIGRNLGLLSEVVERVRWAQQKDYSSTTISLDKKSAEDVQAISTFCQQLYDFSFVAKCIHNRQNIDKYLTLRKRLGLSGKNFVMCVTGLGEEHAKGLTAMYDLAFVSERELAAHLARLF